MKAQGREEGLTMYVCALLALGHLLGVRASRSDPEVEGSSYSEPRGLSMGFYAIHTIWIFYLFSQLARFRER